LGGRVCSRRGTVSGCAIAALEGKTVTDVVRDAVNEYVGDFREQRVFATRSRSQANRARRERAIPKAAAA
jgi:hypothetical protein